MKPSIFSYVLPILLWHLLSFSTVFAQEKESLKDAAPVRIALMPFCDESSGLTQVPRPDAQKMYNHTISALKELYECSQNTEWISKNRMGKTIASYISDVGNKSSTETSSCNYSLTESVCQNINADIIVLGEYLVGSSNSVEVYYSFENCEGIYTSGIKYLTSQPIIGTTEDLPTLYAKVSQAIQHDLRSFLGCKAGMSQAELNEKIEKGKSLYRSGESSVLNYLKAIEIFEELINTDHKVPEAIYHLGLAYFSLGEYPKADSFFAQIPEYREASIYKQYCSLKSRPAIWYNNAMKKRVWWNELNNQWKTALSTQTFQLLATEIPSDQDLDSLFNMTSLSIEGVFLPDLVPIQALSNLTQLSCSKTELQNLNGIETLINLGQISINNNKITSLSNISSLPLLTRIYCRNNPLKNLQGVENMNPNRSVIFCGGSVGGKEMKRVRALGLKVQP